MSEELRNQLLTDLGTAVIRPPKWIIKNLLPPGLVFVGGPPKSRKTTFIMAMCLLVSEHKSVALPPFMREVLMPGPVMYLGSEASAGELRHMCEVSMATKVRDDWSIAVCDDAGGFQLNEPESFGQLMAVVEEMDPRVLVVDPLRDFHGLDENDSAAMNKILRPLRKWALDNDASCIVVHHTKKPQDGTQMVSNHDLRGTGALFGMANGILMIQGTQPDGSGPRQVKGTFRGGAGWEYIFTLAAYESVNEEALEVLTVTDKKILQAIKLGATHQDLKVLGLNTGVSPTIAKTSVQKLKRNGLLT